MEANMDDYHLAVKDFDATEPNFSYPGMSRDGQCFLRIRIQKGKPVFLCVQLKDYTGTSITNAVEDILRCSIKMLVKKGIVVSKRKKSFRDFLSQEHFDMKKNEDLLRFFSAKSVWVEHYPPNTGLAPGGSYALVKFDRQLNPSWSYVRKETAVRASTLDTSFFDIPYESLHYERK